MNTLPTILTRNLDTFGVIARDTLGVARPVAALVPIPEGLVLVREDCPHCDDGRAYLAVVSTAKCPSCLGVPLLAWYRECDRCGGRGSVMADCPDPPPQPKTGWGSVSCGVLHLKPCPAGCVEVDGRRLVKVRRNP